MILDKIDLRYHLDNHFIQRTSKCSHLNGGCSNLCLPNPSGRQCSCPEGVRFVLGDPHTCEGGECLFHFFFPTILVSYNNKKQNKQFLEQLITEGKPG